MAIDEKDVLQAMSKVIDPELHIDLVRARLTQDGKLP